MNIYSPELMRHLDSNRLDQAFSAPVVAMFALTVLLLGASLVTGNVAALLATGVVAALACAGLGDGLISRRSNAHTA